MSERLQSYPIFFLKNLPKQKISRVLFLPSKSGDDDHQSGMPIARHLKRPTRKLSCLWRDEAGNLFFLTWSCSQVGFAQPDVTTGPGGLLHHLFTLGQMAGLFSVALSVPCGPSGYEALCPGELGLSSPIFCWDRG
jgi:hypothetical protein